MSLQQKIRDLFKNPLPASLHPEVDSSLSQLAEFLPELSLQTLIKYQNSNDALNRAVEIMDANPNLLTLTKEEKRLIILKAYQSITYLQDHFLDTMVLSELLKDNLRGTASLSEEQIKDYSLSLLKPSSSYHNGYCREWGNRIIDRKQFSVFLDATIAVALIYKGLPNALVGMTIYDSSTLTVIQIQGVRPTLLDKYPHKNKKGGSWGLVPLDWTKLMVEISELLAEQLKFKELSIQSEKNNQWFKELNHHRTAKIYDETAERLGFYQKKDQNWYKTLNSA